jgi:hypothetical protein
MLDLLEAQTDPERGDIYPLVPFSRIRAALPFVTRTIRTHMDYANATIQDLLEPTGVESQVYAISTMDHVLFLSEDGSFVGAPLPAEAQFAPAFYAGIADFNGDGNEDLFLSHRFRASRCTEINAVLRLRTMTATDDWTWSSLRTRMTRSCTTTNVPFPVCECA